MELAPACSTQLQTQTACAMIQPTDITISSTDNIINIDQPITCSWEEGAIPPANISLVISTGQVQTPQETIIQTYQLPP